MAISIKEAARNVLSEKYNKLYIFYLFIIFVLMTFPYIPYEYVHSINIYSISGWFLFFLFYILASGLQIIAINNGYSNKPCIFPCLFSDYKPIFKTGLKFIIGAFVIGIGVTVSLFIALLPVFLIALKLHHIHSLSNETVIYGAIILVYSILLFFESFIILGLILNFCKTLKIADLINVKSAWDYIKQVRKLFFIYILKLIGIGILALGLYLLYMYLFSLIPKPLFSLRIGCLIYFVYSLIWIDLSIQFLKEADKYVLDKIKNEQKEEEIDKYIENV